MSNTPDYTESIAYHVGMEKFLYKLGGRWQLSTPVSGSGIKKYLLDFGLTPEQIKSAIDAEQYTRVYGIDSSPNDSSFVNREGWHYLNTWVPPTLQPVEGPWPRIERVLTHLCDGDEAAVEHLVNWLAYKIQNPAAIPRTAVVFGTAQGGGKGSLFKILSEMLGHENCIEVGQLSLESRFNGDWAGKLLVLANEVVNGDNMKDISERLKILIDSPRIAVERKGQDVYTIQNVTAWLFATNATTGGVKVEEGDRRFNVFTNFAPLTDEYRDLVDSLWGEGGHGWSEDGLREVQGFYQFLRSIPTDESAVGRPIRNAARQALIESSVPFHDLFKKEVAENTIDPYIRALAESDEAHAARRSKSEWDFGPDGVSVDVVYDAYVHYTGRNGGKPLRKPKFKTAVEVSHPKWEKTRRNVPNSGGNKKTNCYVVPRETK